MRLQKTLILALVVGLGGVLAGTGSASAHARLKESTPKVGEVVSTSPAAVAVTFSNDIQKIAGTYGIAVTDEAGASVTAGPAAVNDANRSQLSVPLQPGLPAGRYVVKYKNVSDADGDPFEGGFAFYVGVQPTAAQLAADQALLPKEEAAPTAAVATPAPAVSRSPVATATAATSGGNGGGGISPWIIAAGVAVVLAVGAVIVMQGSNARRKGRGE